MVMIKCRGCKSPVLLSLSLFSWYMARSSSSQRPVGNTAKAPRCTSNLN